MLDLLERIIPLFVYVVNIMIGSQRDYHIVCGEEHMLLSDVSEEIVSYPIAMFVMDSCTTLVAQKRCSFHSFFNNDSVSS